MSFSGSRNRLLSIGAPPPDFGFGDEGAFYRLSQLRGRKRALLVLSHDVNPACIDGMRSVKSDWTEYRNHEVIVMLISAASDEILSGIADQESPPMIMISDDREETMARYGIRGSDGPIAYLVEKDGLISALWNHWPSSREVFECIDRDHHRERRAA